MSEKTSPLAWGCLGLIGAAVAMAIIVGISSNSTPVAPAPAGPPSLEQRRLVADETIKLRLKAPATYRRVTAAMVWSNGGPTGNQAFVFRVQYDAQNGFGALLRGCDFVGVKDGVPTSATTPIECSLGDSMEKVIIANLLMDFSPSAPAASQWATKEELNAIRAGEKESHSESSPSQSSVRIERPEPVPEASSSPTLTIPRSFVVILKNGSSVTVKAPYTPTGSVALIQLPNGKLTSLPIEDVDEAATKKANAFTPPPADSSSSRGVRVSSIATSIDGQAGAAPGVAGSFGGRVAVRGYTKNNGTYVAPYTRSAPTYRGSSSGGSHGGGKH
jgi:hypothetical protein